MIPDQKRLVVQFVKQLQQCIEKREPTTLPGSVRHSKRTHGSADVASINCRHSQDKK